MVKEVVVRPATSTCVAGITLKYRKVTRARPLA